jgi:hypothetical protein
MKQHDVSLDDRGELDEVFVSNADVHLERMSDGSFWIGIRAKGKPDISINTGMFRREWFFNLEVDAVGGQRLYIRRPRRSRRKKTR